MSQEVYEKLKAPFPPEALSTDSSRGFNLTSVKAQFVKERLNEVFGPFGWRMKGEYVNPSNQPGIVYRGHLMVKNITLKEDEKPLTEWHSIEAVGYAGNKKNAGDMYKSAATDALSKAASNLGIANEVFKGEVAVPDAPIQTTTPKAPQAPVAASKDGVHTITWGKKYKGRSFPIGNAPDDIKSFADWLNSQQHQPDFKGFSQGAKDLFAAIEGSPEKPTLAPADMITTEEIPF